MVVIFCTKCGATLDEEAVFCSSCGERVLINDDSTTPISEETDAARNLPNPEADRIANKLVCPTCRSTNLISVIKPVVSGGNSGLDACCGYALLGPLGLICGLHETKVDNQTHWICQQCGEQFRDSKELLSQMFNYGIACIIVGVILFRVLLYLESGFSWLVLIFGIGPIVIGIALTALWIKSKK